MQGIVEKEWAEFKRVNEQLMREEGITNIDDLIEDSIQEANQENDVHLIQEQQELEYAIASYEQSKLCVNCKKAMLSCSNNSPIASCSQCGFYATEQCLSQIDIASFSHGSFCQGSIEYSLEPGTDNTLLAVCNICDLWDMFYM